MKTIPNISRLLQRLDHAKSTEFIISITGGKTPLNFERKLIFPNKTLGTTYTNIFRVIRMWWQQFLFTDRSSANEDYKPRKKIRKQTKILTVLKTRSPNFETAKILKIKHNQKRNNGIKKKLNEFNQQTGPSIWLSLLPLIDEGYVGQSIQEWPK